MKTLITIIIAILSINSIAIERVDVAEFRVDREYYADQTIILTGGVLNNARSLFVYYNGKKGGTSLHMENFLYRKQKLTTFKECDKRYSLSNNNKHIPNNCLVDVKVKVDYLKKNSMGGYKDIRLRNIEILYK